jgi:hypothetical protein
MTDKGKKQRPADRPYETGYGKPPAHARFAKGQSGNPKGRPRRPKPAAPSPTDMSARKMLEHELYRIVPLRENGKLIELPAYQATARSYVNEGIKGKRLTQKSILKEARQLEQENLELQVAEYFRLVALKRQGKKLIADHQARGLPPPVLLPHPDDICIIDPFRYIARVDGPETEEQAHYYAEFAAYRDALLICHVHAERAKIPFTSIIDGQECCVFQFFAMLIDQWLPRSFQISNAEMVTRLWQYRCLTVGERENRIAAQDPRLVTLLNVRADRARQGARAKREPMAVEKG